MLRNQVMMIAKDGFMITRVYFMVSGCLKPSRSLVKKLKNAASKKAKLSKLPKMACSNLVLFR